MGAPGFASAHKTERYSQGLTPDSEYTDSESTLFSERSRLRYDAAVSLYRVAIAAAYVTAYEGVVSRALTTQENAFLRAQAAVEFAPCVKIPPGPA